MKGMQVFCIVFLISMLNVRPVDTKAIAVLSTITEVVSFGMDLYSFFDSSLAESESEESIDYDRIINSISERIQMSTGVIINRIELQSYISDVRDVALVIKQLLSDVVDILNASDESARKVYQTRFKKQFENERAGLYKIKSLLTFRGNFGGITSSLLTLIANQYDCSIPLVWEFKNYYMTLVSDVVALALLNEKLSSDGLYNETLSSWRQEIAVLLSDFKRQEDSCIKVSLVKAKTDFERTENAKELFRTNIEKYPNLITDVLRLGGSYCALALKGYDNLFKKSSGSTWTFEFISSGENNINYSQKQLERIAASVDFNNCKGSADMIQLFFHTSKHDLVLWVMYPANHAVYSDILLNNNSTAHLTTSVAYRIVTYLRTHDGSKNKSLSSNDFDKYFHIMSSKDEESSGLKGWELGLIIASSVIIVFILSGLCIYWCCCKTCG